MTFILVLATALGYAQEEEDFVASDIFASVSEGDKAALLMVHFGTTHDDTRALTIDMINRKAAEAFSGIEVREAWSSRIVMRRIKARGVEKLNPSEALDRLHEDGFTHIIIQSTNVIDGAEMESLRKDVESKAAAFKEVRIGTPLLYKPEDYEAVVEAITQNGLTDGANVLVGHGTYNPATAQYAMMDYMLKAKGYTNFFVGTIEGYPSFDTMLIQLKASGLKRVQLMPFMFVAGDHANNDIAVDWKEALESEGFEVTVFMEGLGQNAAIQDLYISHARHAASHRAVDLTAKKKAYATADD